jgi:hypothetical protein
MLASQASDTRKSVEGRQRHQGVVGGVAEAGGDQQGSDFVSVQADSVGLVVQPGRRTWTAGEWSSSSSPTA